MGMPKEGEAGDDTHQIDENHGGELDIADALVFDWMELHEKLHEPELVKEIEELIEQTGFPEPVNLGDVFAVSEILGDSRLIS